MTYACLGDIIRRIVCGCSVAMHGRFRAETGKRSVPNVLATLLAAGALWHCTLPGPSSADSVEYRVKSDRILVAWDPPASPSTGASGTAAYYVYYRRYGGGSWRTLGCIAASERPEFIIRHEDVGDGAWEFGVAAVAGSGRQSATHASVDDTASPFGGWHIRWERTD